MKKNLMAIPITLGTIAGIAAGSIAGLSYYLFKLAYGRKLPKSAKKIFSMNNAPTEREKEADERYVAQMHETDAYIAKKDTADMYITSFDGTQLYGKMVWAGKNVKKTVLCVHGYHGTPTADFGGMVEYYMEHGYNVLLLDNRAHGKSEGEYLGFGWLDRLDIVMWCRRLVQILGTHSEIILAGVSMGGAAVMMASGEDLPRQVKGIIEDCGYATTVDQFKAVYPKQLSAVRDVVLHIDNIACKVVNGYYYTSANATTALKKNSLPTLFIHGGDDKFVPTSMVYEVFDAQKGPKELYISEGAGHAQSYIVNPERYKEVVTAFLEKYKL